MGIAYNCSLVTVTAMCNLFSKLYKDSAGFREGIEKGETVYLVSDYFEEKGTGTVFSVRDINDIVLDETCFSRDIVESYFTGILEGNDPLIERGYPLHSLSFTGLCKYDPVVANAFSSLVVADYEDVFTLDFIDKDLCSSGEGYVRNPLFPENADFIPLRQEFGGVDSHISLADEKCFTFFSSKLDKEAYFLDVSGDWFLYHSMNRFGEGGFTISEGSNSEWDLSFIKVRELITSLSKNGYSVSKVYGSKSFTGKGYILVII